MTEYNYITNKKNSFLTAVLVIVFILSIIPVNVTNAAQQNGLPEVYYQWSNLQILTSGATYENIVKFTTEGWFNINVIRVDLTNPYVKLDAIVNNESIQKLTSVPDLAKSANAVGAVNAGFFNWSKTPGLSSPIGPIVSDGNLITTNSDFNRYNDNMASFSIDKLNNIFYEYWKTDIKLIKEDGTYVPVERYNVQLNNNGDITVITRKWSSLSLGKPKTSENNTATTPTTSTYTDIVEMVVEDDVVKQIRKNLPPIEVPENGYIVIAADKNIKKITDNFKEGDAIKLDITTKPDWNEISMAITGGAIIVKDGKIPSKFSHDSPGRNPRTAIGSSKDGKEVIMVTVDGRQQKSLGMTLTELAYLMLELGAYNAINLDGGGSTTMAIRNPGTNNISVVNSPSDGMARKIANAVGVFSVAPESSTIAGLIIDTEDKNIFVNTSRSFTVRAYDNFFNPVAIDSEQVTWSVSDIEGDFIGNVFYPRTVGKGKIIATIGEVSGELEINCLTPPVEIELSEKLISMQINTTKQLSVKGKNIDGYSAKINPEDINWSVYGNIGKFEGTVFHATTEGKGYIEASIGDVKAYCGVKVARDTVVVVDNFEKINGTYLSYPANIPGKYELSSEQKRSGKYSGKLTYDFNDSTGSRASYLLLSNGGIELGNNVKKIGIWVYNINPNPNWLRGLVYDANGKAYYLDFTQNLDWTGWKYVELSVDGIEPRPLRLARIYLVQIRDVPDAGHIYLDDLTFISVPDPDDENFIVPENTKSIDKDNREVDFKEGDDAFRFTVFGQIIPEPSNPLENLLMKSLCLQINETADKAAFIGSNSKKAENLVKEAFIMAYVDLKSKDFKNSRFISLDTRKGGLRLSHTVQWKWFLTQLRTFKGDNVFIFMENHPDTFTDKLEAELFRNILSEYHQETGRNVWVFYKSNRDDSYMENGVKYISTAGFEIGELTPERAIEVKYLYVTVQGKEVTFEFKPVVH
ncbi:MAG TPA: phosphodiester glycosidase family protein [Clostridiaceae bacterium]|nr:phosphodiester glycosidase family protein [Clostridiaceae bacterium]